MIKANLNSVVPSSEKIQKLLEDHSPLILLIDELIEYLIPARAIKIASSTLDSQILSFMKRLGEVVKSIDKVVLLTTSPSGTQYNQDDQLLLTLLDERLGRVEKVYTPVEDFEISRVVRKRLFSSIDNKQMEKIVLEVIEYYKTQNLIPSGYEPSEYKSKFLDSYPFLPDVIDCLYQRWGTFHSFQRTRGVLRILSLIIFNLKDSDISYITLSHFNLNNQEIRREFLRHIDSTYDGVIASDITDKGSGAKQIDKIVNPSYQGLHLGTYSSTTIFLYSFSGGQEKGVTLNEIKRSVSLPGIPSSVVSEAVDLLKDKLFFIQQISDRFYFGNKPNLNKVLLTKIENIEETEVIEYERDQLQNLMKKGNLKIYIWPDQSSDIADDQNLKLIILKSSDESILDSFLEKKGSFPRVHKNTLFFLTPFEEKIHILSLSLKRKLAYDLIEKDNTIMLNNEELKEIKNFVAKEKENIKLNIREVYRIIQNPKKKGYERIDLGIPTFGIEKSLIDEIFSKLKEESLIIEKITPFIIKEKYLKINDYVSTKEIIESASKTLDEPRILNSKVYENSIKDGVKQGFFGIGNIDSGKNLFLEGWKKTCNISFDEYEVIINESVVKKLLDENNQNVPISEKSEEVSISIEEIEKEEEGVETNGEEENIRTEEFSNLLKKLEINFLIPKGKLSDILRLLNYIQTKFNNLEITIKANDGEITSDEVDDKIKETLSQLGIKGNFK